MTSFCALAGKGGIDVHVACHHGAQVQHKNTVRPWDAWQAQGGSALRVLAGFGRQVSNPNL